MKRVIVASDSFKGTLSSVRVYEIIKEVLTEEYNGIEVTGIPVADGGEGTVDAFLCALGGERVYTTVKSPLMRDIESFYGLLPDGTAVIELAAASGITIEKDPDAVNSSTFGTGQLILHAVENGTKKVVLGIGGSATTDGGMGCAAALGVKFLDKNGCSVPLSGKGLSMVEKVDLSGIPEAVKSAEITVLCDVNNPLYGKNGAAYIYSPQKGADKKTVEYLDKGLRNLAEKTEKSVGKDFSSEKGSGAAGGMGFAMISFFNAKLMGGSDCILSLTDFESKAKTADLIITGEGKMDFQSIMGKVPFSVAKKSSTTKVIAIVGVNEAAIEDVVTNGISEVYETNSLHLPFDEIKDKAEEMLRETVKKLLSTSKIFPL